MSSSNSKSSNRADSSLLKTVCPDLSHHFQINSPMPKHPPRCKSFRLAGAITAALFVLWALWSFTNPNPNPPPVSPSAAGNVARVDASEECVSGVDMRYDPAEPTFYDDPRVGYGIGSPVKNWDEKRWEWLRRHPSFLRGSEERVLMVTGSQPEPCRNPIGDHLLLRFFKNKVDYCRRHGHDIFYNNVLFQPRMFGYWGKIPVIRAAMVAHPEAEWIWWVDSDAAFTDMDFKLPLERYREHNLVVHGWSELIYEKRSWTSLNAGVFLIRNCQWSMEFLEVWGSMGPQTPNYERWGQTLRSALTDKMFPESDDQSGLVYILLKEKDTWGKKVYLEGEFYLEGYWLEILETIDNITHRYRGIERRVGELRRRHAEKVSEAYGERWEEELEGAGNGRGSWRRPFVTHFTGCQPCSGAHNRMYSGQSCWAAMQKALNFADDQVLRNYGFFRPDLTDSSAAFPTPFDFPA